MKDVDIREGYDAIAEAISDCVATGEPCEIYNSDEDFDGDPAPRAVMVSRSRFFNDRRRRGGPDRMFVDDTGRRWEWCGGVEGTWAWRVTALNCSPCEGTGEEMSHADAQIRHCSYCDGTGIVPGSESQTWVKGQGWVGGSGTGGAGGSTTAGSMLFAVTPEGKRIDPDEDGVLHCSQDDEVVMISGGGGGGGGMKPCGGGMKPCTCPCINCSNGQHWLCHGEGVEIDTVQTWVGSPDDGDDENEEMICPACETDGSASVVDVGGTCPACGEQS